MKKIISLMVLSMVMCMILVGCGGKKTSNANVTDDPDKEVTLTLALSNSQQEDTDKVVKAINKELETLLPNTKIELLLDAGLSDKWVLWMSTQKEVDLVHTGFSLNIEDEVRNKTIIGLDELIEANAPTISKLREDYWHSYNNGEVNGTLYAIPNVQYLTKETLYLTVWKEASAHMDLIAMKNVAWSSTKTTEEFYRLFGEGLDKAKAAGVDCSGCINTLLYQIAQRGYVFIGGADSNLCYEKDGDGTIIDFYTTDEFKTFCKYMKDWAAKGYVSKDVLTGAWTEKTAANVYYRYSMNLETGLREQFVSDEQIMLGLDNPDLDVLTTEIGENGSYWSVPYTSENPARAIKFVDLLHSEEGAVIANLLAYGIEGEHYEVVDEENGDIRAFEYEAQAASGASYGIQCWKVSNMMQGMYNVAPYTHEFKEYGEWYYGEHLNEVKKSVLYGFNFNLDGVRNEFSQILKNNKEYALSIYSGVVGNEESLLTELLEKNKQAGQENVMKELQKQANEWMSSNK